MDSSALVVNPAVGFPKHGSKLPVSIKSQLSYYQLLKKDSAA